MYREVTCVTVFDSEIRLLSQVSVTPDIRNSKETAESSLLRRVGDYLY